MSSRGVAWVLVGVGAFAVAGISVWAWRTRAAPPRWSLAPPLPAGDASSREAREDEAPSALQEGTFDAEGRRACDGSAPGRLRLVRVASGLSQPLYVLSEPGDAKRLYVLEKAGRVKRIVDERYAETVLTLKVRSDGEMGLLGMAFHPRFGPNERRVYLSYVDPQKVSVLSEWKMPADHFDPESERVLFRLPQELPNHKGGMVAFGPDGWLYYGLGDGGGANDQLGNGQDLTNPFASLLRFDVENPDTSVPGNSSGPGEDRRVHHHGLRNPWRFSFDAKTGDLYIGDAGQDDWEEINVVPSDAPAANFGWPTFEGTHRCKKCKTNVPEPNARMVPPVFEYAHHGGGASVTGGYVYRGKRIPALEGRYLYGDFVLNWVRAFTWNGRRVCDELDLTKELDPEGRLLGVASFGEDAERELYVVSFVKGEVFRIEAEPSP